MSLFDPIRLRHLAFEYPRPAESTAEGLALIDRLTTRQSNGTLQVLTETRIEQSFNERLFADLFGYRTLFSHGGGDYELVPKTHTPGATKQAANRYDDFSLGLFGPAPRSGMALVSAELKGPGTDLDARPSPKKPSPVAQAHSGAPASALWVILSNFDELRLYRKGDEVNFERLLLSDVVDPWDLDRATVLFSRETLLGADGQASPLERLAAGGPPFMIPPKTGCVRLAHELRPARLPAQPLLLSQMEDAIKEGMAAMPPNVWPRRVNDWAARVRDDRLVVETIEGGVPTMSLEVTRSGVLLVTEFPETRPDTPAILDAQNLACRVASFVTLGRLVMAKLGIGTAQYRWSIHDVPGTVVGAPVEWAGGIFSSTLSFPATTPSAHTPPLPMNAQSRSALTALVVRELLFSCEGRTLTRIAPSATQIDALLAGNPNIPKE